jgi:nucleoid DNA-binding protein
MKTQQELIEHVTTATGVARADVRKVVDAAFAFVRESALAGAGLVHPSLGAVRVRERTGKDGEKKTVYRFDPTAKAGGGKGKAGGAGKGKRGGRKAAAKPADEAS